MNRPHAEDNLETSSLAFHSYLFLNFTFAVAVQLVGVVRVGGFVLLYGCRGFIAPYKCWILLSRKSTFQLKTPE